MGFPYYNYTTGYNSMQVAAEAAAVAEAAADQQEPDDQQPQHQPQPQLNSVLIASNVG